MGPTYARMSLAQKQRVAVERQREPAVACPRCETQTTAADLLRHVGTCPGRRAPHPASKWVGWREAIDLGVSRSTLSFWAHRGMVRVQGEPERRRYLLRDLTVRIANRRQRFSPLNLRKAR